MRVRAACVVVPLASSSPRGSSAGDAAAVAAAATMMTSYRDGRVGVKTVGLQAVGVHDSDSRFCCVRLTLVRDPRRVVGLGGGIGERVGMGMGMDLC